MTTLHENPVLRYARRGSSRIKISLRGEGRAVVLSWDTLLKVRDLFYLANPSWSRLRHHFTFPWITDPNEITPAFERVLRRERISESERKRLEWVFNQLIVRKDFPLHSTSDIVHSYFAKGRQSHPRRMLGTIFNGLMMELAPLSVSRLLASPETMVLQQNGARLFALRMFLGTDVTGPRSDRKLSAKFVSFYDRTLARDLSLQQLHESRWYRVANFEPAPGFKIVD